MVKATLNIILLLFISLSTKGQTAIHDYIVDRFTTQLSVFPQEKIYLHTDKNVYVAGERIWFTAYLLDAAFHLPTFDSRYVYVELINPLDSVVRRIKIKATDNCYCGYLPIEEELPEGNYSIKAYTHFMENISQEYWFHKTIQIGNPSFRKIGLISNFNYNEKKKRIYVTFSFNDKQNGNAKQPGHVRAIYKKKELKIRYSEAKQQFSAFFYPEEGNNTLYIESGEYKAYLQVPDYNDKNYSIGFYPEGGQMVEGQMCKVAFKAVAGNGMGITIKGYVEDENKQRICELKTLHRGMGFFYINPSSDHKYHAVCKDAKGTEKIIELPTCQKEKETLKVETRNGKIFVGKVQSKGTNPRKTYLVLHTRGLVYYVTEWEHYKEYYTFEEEKLPAGILAVMLLDEKCHPVSERLVFCHNSKDYMQGNIQTEKDSYGLREKVISNVTICDRNGNRQAGQASIAVTRDEDVEPDSCASIYANILFTSDLRGYIEDPVYYFRKTDEDKRKLALDILLLTQGWRRYDVPALLQSKFSFPAKELEIGSQITGTVKNHFLNKPYPNALVSMLVPQFNYANITQSDEDGKFIFNGFEFPDSTRYILQVMKKSGKTENLKVEVDKDLFPTVISFFPKNMETSREAFDRYITSAEEKYPGIQSVLLEEVTIYGQQKKTDAFHQTFAHNSNSYSTWTAKKIKEGRYNDIFDILKRIQGVRILPNGNINIGNSFRNVTPKNSSAKFQFNTPLIIIDGIPYENVTEKIAFDLRDIPIDNVERLDVYRGINAVIFGPAGSAGVISITTKRGVYNSKEKDIRYYIIESNNLLLGYEKYAEFYSPVYTPNKKYYKPDPRTTIYWNPNIKFNEMDNTKFEFYTADKPGTYTFILEGVTDKGKVFHQKKKITIE